MATEHFPSSPTRPPKYVLYFRSNSSGRQACHGFCTLTAAASFLNEVTQHLDQKPLWTTDTSFSQDDLSISSEHLEDIVECDDLIILPYPYPSLAAQIAGGTSQTFEAPPQSSAPKTQKPSKAPAARKTNNPSAATAGTIADALNIEPSKVRRILRATNTPKPYEWTDPATIEQITNLVRSKL